MALNTTPRTWVAGETITAAMMNTEVREPVRIIQLAWDGYTPTWTASVTAPALGNGTLAGRYMRVGRTIDVLILLTWGSTTTGGDGNWSFSLPFSAKSGIGSRLHLAATRPSQSVNHFQGLSTNLSGASTGVLLYPSTTLTGDLNGLTGTAPGAWSSGDTLSIWGRYEAA